MGDLQKVAFRLFKEYANPVIPLFPDLKKTLKQASMPYTIQEYISMAMLVGIMAFVGTIPVFALLFTILFSDFLFGFLFAILAAGGATAAIFFMVLQYPTLSIKEKSKGIDNALPFAAMYLSTISSSKLPLFKTFQIFTKFAKYGELVKQIENINDDTKLFGLDIISALERAIERSPSKDFRELLYGMLSTIRSGANMNIYLNQKSISFMNDYRRRLYQFSQSLTVFVEIYLTSIVLGAIFFTVLTAIISGISGAGSDIIMLQFMLIFIFMPLISIVFIYLIKSATPGEE